MSARTSAAFPLAAPVTAAAPRIAEAARAPEQPRRRPPFPGCHQLVTADPAATRGSIPGVRGKPLRLREKPGSDDHPERGLALRGGDIPNGTPSTTRGGVRCSDGSRRKEKGTHWTGRSRRGPGKRSPRCAGPKSRSPAGTCHSSAATGSIRRVLTARTNGAVRRSRPARAKNGARREQCGAGLVRARRNEAGFGEERGRLGVPDTGTGMGTTASGGSKVRPDLGSGSALGMGVGTRAPRRGIAMGIQRSRSPRHR